MLDILRKFFRFCDERERKEFYISIGLGVAAAYFFCDENSMQSELCCRQF